MNETATSPIIVALLFILRCLVPLAVLFGISYLLRRLGLVAETPEPPVGYEDNGASPSVKKKKPKKES